MYMQDAPQDLLICGQHLPDQVAFILYIIKLYSLYRLPAVQPVSAYVTRAKTSSLVVTMSDGTRTPESDYEYESQFWQCLGKLM